MKISELLSEQITPVGSTGSTAGSPGSVGSVSQTPPKTSPYSPAKPAQPTQQQDPNRQKLAQLLSQNNVKPDELESATAALQAAFTNPNAMDAKQKELLGKITPGLIKNPAALTAIKGSIAAIKPGSTTTPPVK